MLCGKGQSLLSRLNWLPFLFITDPINWAYTDTMTHLLPLSWWIKVHKERQVYPRSSLTLLYYQWPLPPSFAPQPLRSHLLFPSPAQDLLAFFPSPRRWSMHLLLLLLPLLHVTFRCIFDEELCKKFPVISWLTLGCQRRERHWGVTGRCCQTGQSA